MLCAQKHYQGGVSEWSKELAWKAGKPKGFEGSNPSPSAKIYKGNQAISLVPFVVYGRWGKLLRASLGASLGNIQSRKYGLSSAEVSGELNPFYLDSMPSQPVLALLIVRHGSLQATPEVGCMVGLVQMHEFMDDHVLGDMAR